MAASFCSNKPDVGWGRIEKKIADHLGRWMDQFTIPSSLAMLAAVLLFFFLAFFPYQVTLQPTKRRQAVVLP